MALNQTEAVRLEVREESSQDREGCRKGSSVCSEAKSQGSAESTCSVGFGVAFDQLVMTRLVDCRYSLASLAAGVPIAELGCSLWVAQRHAELPELAACEHAMEIRFRCSWCWLQPR